MYNLQIRLTENQLRLLYDALAGYYALSYEKHMIQQVGETSEVEIAKLKEKIVKLKEIVQSSVIAASSTHDLSNPEAHFERDLNNVLAEVRDTLLAKNAAYGDSALRPLRIFSGSGHLEQIAVRIDDKLSRLARGKGDTEDTKADLLGYLILDKIAKMQTEQENVQ